MRNWRNCRSGGANGEASELAPLTPPLSAYEGWPKDAITRNVVRLYALVAQDTTSGSRSAHNFRDTLALHETLDAIERSATGSNPK
jgi:hypothetical protein